MVLSCSCLGVSHRVRKRCRRMLSFVSFFSYQTTKIKFSDKFNYYVEGEKHMPIMAQIRGIVRE